MLRKSTGGKGVETFFGSRSRGKNVLRWTRIDIFSAKRIFECASLLSACP